MAILIEMDPTRKEFSWAPLMGEPSNVDLMRHVAAAAMFNFHRSFIDERWRPMDWASMNDEQRAFALTLVKKGMQFAWQGRA